MNLVHSFVLTHALMFFSFWNKFRLRLFRWNILFIQIQISGKGYRHFFGWHTCLNVVPNHNQPTNRPKTKENRNVWDFLEKNWFWLQNQKFSAKNFNRGIRSIFGNACACKLPMTRGSNISQAVSSKETKGKLDTGETHWSRVVKGGVFTATFANTDKVGSRTILSLDKVCARVCAIFSLSTDNR